MENEVSKSNEFRNLTCEMQASQGNRAFCEGSLVKLNDQTKAEINTEWRSISQAKRWYLSEFELFDGEAFIIFNIVDINTNCNSITVAVTNRGKISVITYELLADKDGKLYFEYGACYEKVEIDDFEEV
ncbi:MAG: hypothetical protein RR405_04790 [Clostridia bacterium]